MEQQKFLLCCGFFVGQAKAENREVQFKATVEGRYLGAWGVNLSKDMAKDVSATYQVHLFPHSTNLLHTTYPLP